MINAKTVHKVFQFSPISEKIEVYHADELKKIWTSDPLRDWDLYVKYPKFDDWSSWNSNSGGNR